MRFAVRAVALSAAAAALCAASPPPALPLAAVAAASGHAALVHVRARATGTLEGRPFEVTFERFGASLLMRRCIAEVCDGSWFDGNRRWTFGLNEVLLPDDGDLGLPQRRTLNAIASYLFAEPAFRSQGGTVAVAGPDAWRVRAHDGAELIARVDPATHRLRSVETEAGETLAGFQGSLRAGPATIPREQSGADSVSLDSGQAVPGPIVPPAGPAVTYAGDGALKLSGDPVPIVPCTLAGHAVKCLIDTGATPSAIALPLAEQLGLEPRGELDIAAFDQFATGFVEAGPLSLGAARFERARFAVVPSTYAARFDVVVGADLLARVRLRLDRAHGLAQITAPNDGSAGPAPVVATIPLRFREGTPRLDAVLDGRAQQGAVFDSGDQSQLSFGYAAYRNGTQWPLVSRTQAVGMGDASEDAFIVDVPQVRIGPYDAGTTRAIVRRTQSNLHVGIGLWERFSIEIDEAAAQLVLHPR